jgi:hypothetical protein
VRRAPTIVRAGVAFGIACLLAVAGCSTDGEGTDREPAGLESADRGRTETESANPERAESGPTDRGRAPPPPSVRLRHATCPSDAANCRTASGRVLYAERVDPDGDGDAHFVLASRDSITGPGISVIDVKPSLRPSPLPGRGDRLSAAGPVYRGSYGQRQIEANELHVARAR